LLLSTLFFILFPFFILSFLIFFTPLICFYLILSISILFGL
jgi:hypothetical protein